jgi:uncharacterized membrane protein
MILLCKLRNLPRDLMTFFLMIILITTKRKQSWLKNMGIILINILPKILNIYDSIYLYLFIFLFFLKSKIINL